MIIDKSHSRLDQIKTFAKENNLMESFKEAFSGLQNYSEKGYDVKFSITSNGKHILYGGLMFHNENQ